MISSNICPTGNFNRYFVVPYKRKDEFLQLVKLERRNNRFKSSIRAVFDKECKLWAINSNSKEILTHDFISLKEFEPHKVEIYNRLDFSEASQWAMQVLESNGFIIDHLKQPKNRFEWVRCRLAGDPKGTRNGGYKFYMNDTNAFLNFVNYKRNVNEKVFLNSNKNANGEVLSDEELELAKLHNKAIFAQEKENRKALQAEEENKPNLSEINAFLGTYNSGNLWQISPYSINCSAYLQKKLIKDVFMQYGAELNTDLYIIANPNINDFDLYIPELKRKLPWGTLLIPIKDFYTKELLSFQLIEPTGSKKFLSGLQLLDGVFCVNGQVYGREKAIVVEGLATGISLFAMCKAQGVEIDFDILIAFSYGRLFSISKDLIERKIYKNILVIADDDRTEDGNMKKALPDRLEQRERGVLRTINYRTLFKTFNEKLELAQKTNADHRRLTDFNDIHYFCYYLNGIELNNQNVFCVNRVIEF